MKKVTVGDCEFLTDPPELRNRAGTPIPLRAQTSLVLQYLVANANRTVLKEELWQSIWSQVVVTDDSLVQCIAEIRRAIGDSDRKFVKTVYKRGYLLSVDDLVPSFDEDAAAFSQTVNQAVSADGSRIAYAISGSGCPLLRAPHWMTHVELDWQDGLTGDRIRRLSKELQVIRYDGRGTGMSDRSVGPGGLEDWISDMCAVADNASLDQFALLGVSGGGAISIRYASHYPERVSCLVLLGSKSRCIAPDEVGLENLESFCSIIKTGWGKKTEALQKLLVNMVWPGADENLVSSFVRLQLASCDGETAAEIISKTYQLSVECDLQQVSVPTLVVHSRGDPAVPLAEAEYTANKIPNARLLVLDSDDHSPLPGHIEYEKYMSEIVKFVKLHCRQ